VRHRSTTSLCETVTVRACGTSSREDRALTAVDLKRETPFAARLPLADDGLAYWTVLDADLRRVAVVDDYLFSLARSGRAENTGKAYARDIAIFLRWCDSRRRHWQDVAALDDFQAFLLVDPARNGRGPRRETTANRLLTAVRGLLRFCIEAGHLPRANLGRLYSIKDYRFLPVEARGERPISDERLSPRHHLRAPLDAEPPRVIAEAQFVAMLRAARSNRDRLLISVMHDCGLRVGEALGLRREDVHLLEDSGHLGCEFEGPHLHVRRRRNANGAVAKSRRARTVPAPPEVVEWYGLYLCERDRIPPARRSAYLFVNLASAPGAPMRYRNVWELVGRLARAAGIPIAVSPHTLRHCYGTSLADAERPIDVIAELMGHGSLRSTMVYLHPSRQRRRAAVAHMAGVRDLARKRP
jgi:integrase/recombinase XerD